MTRMVDDRDENTPIATDRQSHCLNDLMAALWPYLRHGVEAAARDAIQSATQSGAIPYLDGLVLQHLEPFGPHTPELVAARVHAPNNEPLLEAVLRCVVGPISTCTTPSRWPMEPRMLLHAGFAPPLPAANGQGAPPSAQQGSTRVDPTARRDSQLRAHVQLDSSLRTELHVPLQPLIEAMLPAGTLRVLPRWISIIVDHFRRGGQGP